MPQIFNLSYLKENYRTLNHLLWPQSSSGVALRNSYCLTLSEVLQGEIVLTRLFNLMCFFSFLNLISLLIVWAFHIMYPISTPSSHILPSALQCSHTQKKTKQSKQAITNKKLRTKQFKNKQTKKFFTSSFPSPQHFFLCPGGIVIEVCHIIIFSSISFPSKC